MCAAFARLKTKLCSEEVLLFSEFKMVFISILTLNERNYCIPALRSVLLDTMNRNLSYSKSNSTCEIHY